MDRYWRELDHQRLRHAGAQERVQIVCPFGSPPPQTGESSRLLRAWQKYYAYPWLAGRATRRSEVQTVHVLDHSFAHLLTQMPQRGVHKIVTVHDLAPLRDPSGLTPAQQRRFRRTVEHLRDADLLLAVSQYSARETTALLGVDAAKLRVLPEGVDYARFSTQPINGGGPALPPSLAERKVVLSVGTSIPRKNLQVLPEIFRCLRTAGVTLLRVGAPLPVELAAELRSVLGQDGMVELGGAPDELLILAYQRADALIFPSRIEGFGFPVLEAMAAGCPVVCTNVTSLPEVGGDAALYFAPDDPATAAGHLQRLLGDPSLKEERAAAGQRQAAAFSWARHFENLVAIYEEGSDTIPLSAGRRSGMARG